MRREEIRIIRMTETEYESAMKQFLGPDDYEESRDCYWDYAMNNFAETYAAGLEVAMFTPLQTQYYAVFIDKNGEIIENKLHELPESFSQEAFTGWELEKDEECEQPGKKYGGLNADIESNKEESLNTKISYMYRDACNYKQLQSVILSGELTKGQIQQIYDSCDGEFFIPAQVGLPEIRFGEITEDDSCWFEIGDITLTLDNPTENYTAKEVLDKFLDAKENGWDDVKYAPEISNNEYGV